MRHIPYQQSANASVPISCCSVGKKSAAKKWIHASGQETQPLTQKNEWQSVQTHDHTLYLTHKHTHTSLCNTDLEWIKPPVTSLFHYEAFNLHLRKMRISSSDVILLWPLWNGSNAAVIGGLKIWTLDFAQIWFTYFLSLFEKFSIMKVNWLVGIFQTNTAKFRQIRGVCQALVWKAECSRERDSCGFRGIKAWDFFPWQMHVICYLMKTSAALLLSSEHADVTNDHSYGEEVQITYRCLNLTLMSSICICDYSSYTRACI